MQLVVYKVIINVILEVNKATRKSVEVNVDTELLNECIKKLLYLSQTMPFVSVNIERAADMLYLDLIFNEAYYKFIESCVMKRDVLVRANLAKYMIFEAEWNQWMMEGLFEKKREIAMRAILEDRGMNVEQVEGLMKWDFVRFNKDGFRILGLNIKSGYSRLVGVRFDYVNYTVNYILDNNGEKLFSVADIQTVLECGIVSSAFTLDQPMEPNKFILQSNPFQEMKYGPHCLHKTNYLATLLHTDYLLKMFTMGFNISNCFPFAIKGIEELLEGVPGEVKKILTMLHDTTPIHSAHRFWIEAGDAEYEVKEIAGGVTYVFHDVKMKCKKHLLVYDKDGKLVDSDKDDDDSMEAEFAREFTKNYDVIAKYFPEFARLKELVKMGLMTLIINGQLKHYMEAKGKVKVDVNIVNRHLREIYNKSNYPAYSENKVNDMINSALAKVGATRYSIPYNELQQLEEEARGYLREDDIMIKKYAVESIVKSYPGVSEYDISYYMEDLLLSGKIEDLSALIVNKLKQEQMKNLDSIINMFKRTGINQKIANIDKLTNNGTYCLVPAGFANHNVKYRVYGGVSLGVNPIQSSGGGCGHNTARYIEGVNQKGQWYCNAVAMNTIAAQHHITQQISSGYKSLEPHRNTQAYWCPTYDSSGPNTQHMTHHKDVGKEFNYYVHYHDGTTFETKV